MNFGLNDDQQMLRDTFARFLDDNSSMARVRQANEAGGFDARLWQGLADLAMGRKDTNPLQGLDWPTVPLLSGQPWFLPLVGLYFGLKDRLS